MNKKILEKIREKREFSQLHEKDIESAYAKFSKRQISEDEKIRLTREFLRKIFSAFVSKKLLSLKDKDFEWILRKHSSTRERLPYYLEVYEKIFGDLKKVSLIDLGCGINGFSYKFFEKLDLKINYVGVESVGQLVDFANYFFKKEKFSGKVIHESLLNLEKIIEIIKKEKSPRVVFLFKVVDALESFEKNYSKELILKIVPLAKKIVLSFPTRSLGSRTKFKVNRKWILEFVEENFNVLEDFEIGGERYLVFEKQ